MKEGKNVYYVDSLLFPAIKCKILHIESWKHKPQYITAVSETGELIEGYAHKFTTSKPVMYQMH